MARFKELEREMTDRMLGENPDTQLSEEQIEEVQSQAFLDAAGCNKGRVYGLGSASFQYYSRDALSSNSRVSTSAASTQVKQLQSELYELRKTNDDLASELSTVKSTNVTLTSRIDDLTSVERLVMRMDHCGSNVFDHRPDNDPRDPPPSSSVVREQTFGF